MIVVQDGSMGLPYKKRRRGKVTGKGRLVGWEGCRESRSEEAAPEGKEERSRAGVCYSMGVMEVKRRREGSLDLAGL